MKFKTIFFLFNAIILFSFLFIALMPLFVLGGEYTRIFWKENWFLALIFLLFISVLDGYFLMNWKMFTLLEKEDWPGLIAYLERQIYEKKKITSRNIRMMVNTSLTVSNLDKISRLEKEVSDKKPEILAKHGILLGIPYLLEQNLEEGKAFFTGCINNASEKDKPWLQWCYAFLLLSGREKDEAAPYLSDLGRSGKDQVLKLLSIYLLSTIASPGDGEPEALKKSFLDENPSREKLEKIITRTKGDNVVVLLLSSILDDARNWLYTN